MIETQLTRNGADSAAAPKGEEAIAPLSAHLCSDTSSILDQLLRRYKQDEYEQLNPDLLINESNMTMPGEVSVAAVTPTESLGHGLEKTDCSLLNQAEFEQFDSQIIERLEPHIAAVGSPLSLRQFHERISQVLESWECPGEFINLTNQAWPKVVDARSAYEAELRANFTRYGQNAVRLLGTQTALTDKVMRSQVIERIVAEEIERACNSFKQGSPDFALSRKFSAWQSAIKEFALKALGPA